MSDAHLDDSLSRNDLDSTRDSEAPDSEETEDFASMLEESFSRLKKEADEGQTVRGTVVKISDDSAFIDLGAKSEGVLDLHECRDEEGNITISLGDVIEATVVGTMGEEGALRLSRSLARGAKTLEMIADAYRNRLAVEGRVVARNKGGFEVQIGALRGFVPLSQIDRYKAADPDVHLEQTYQFRITEFKNRGKQLVLSRAQLQKEEAETKARALRESLKEGDVLTGTVRSVRDFGAFVDLGGLDGMVHVSEMSWSRIQHPSEVVKEGDQVTVQVIKYDREKEKISLSLKTLSTSPWEDIGLRWVEGGIYRGKVMRLETFGAFVELAPGLEGLLHVSNMVWDRRIRHPKEVVEVGQDVQVQILSIEPDKKRIGLGMKQLAGDPWDGVLERYPQGAQVEGTVEKVAPFGVFLTLEPGVTGLIPNSEMATARGADHSRQFQTGQVIQAQVLDVNLVERRISLSRKAIAEGKEREDFEAYKAAQPKKAAANEPVGSLGTLGDLLSGVKLKK